MKFVACYIRVSAIENNQAEQRREINRWLKSNRIRPKGVRWYIDKPTAKLRRPKYEALQADIRAGKVRAVVVWRLDRLAERTRDGLNVLIDWCDNSLRVVSVSQEIDVKGTDGGLIASVLRGLADVDREIRGERTKMGLLSAREHGRVGGRPQTAADDPAVLEAKKLQKAGKLGIDEICKKLKISRSTYYRYVGM
jgi:DNA invertase Pin-like site-specific DNA recombinase